MLPPSELNIGGNSAPLMRLFCFKKNTTAQDSVYREIHGRCRCSADKSWAFYLSKNIGGFMQPKASIRNLLAQQKQSKKQLTAYGILAGAKLNTLLKEFKDYEFLSINFGRIKKLSNDLYIIQKESSLLINKLNLITDHLHGRGIYEQN
jgi:hypothetical protein